jgi:hypothetical protein
VFICISIGWCVAGVELAVMYLATRTVGVSGFVPPSRSVVSLPAPLLRRGVFGLGEPNC